jgi:hypothetical protein
MPVKSARRAHDRIGGAPQQPVRTAAKDAPTSAGASRLRVKSCRKAKYLLRDIRIIRIGIEEHRQFSVNPGGVLTTIIVSRSWYRAIAEP